MQKQIYSDALLRILKHEQQISLESLQIIDESYQMTLFLREVLGELKDHVITFGFSDNSEEIEFFRTIKPQILGKLIYYNKLYRIETACPCPVTSGKLYQKYYANELHHIKEEHNDQISHSEFYRYYRSGRTDRDHEFFELGKINYNSGLSSYVFEIDHHFSTYYDYKVARILAYDLLLTYLLTKISKEAVESRYNEHDICWTDSKNALIEMIYALYCSGSLSSGKVGIRKISDKFQQIFRIDLGDIHHAFHRMKERTGSRTVFLDHLKTSVENYMDKDLV
ncbi:RteC domain-containing protein [Chryseobacterium sp. SL1]|uniref:RteC domain-containing protein n=1 Tax=Chryseobacterium sp. SL1 TaxID=2995159 RepID=UPI0022732BF1|nr:RteC domain-containing protein [Chryseobacterium sp. SL1]MCY1662644.1 RteC domain-containing protein [Chryseobacterium sp. SL1]